ncbi:MAG: glycosyltransferase [Coprobacillus cateniformis]|nr:glycosyltransferase [Coprobacillus cateniformis]
MVDILLATYNGEKYIREQIDSILNQTYQDFRILIRDDGSKDETVSIIENYTKKYQGKIVLIQDNIECGSSVSNFMELSKHATADYIMYCDQDDYWFTNKIDSSLNAIRKL